MLICQKYQQWTSVYCQVNSRGQKRIKRCNYSARGAPKAWRIFPGRDHAPDCYIKSQGHRGFGGFGLVWECEIDPALEAWRNQSFEKPQAWNLWALFPSIPGSLASQAYLFDMVITIKKISYTHITPQSEDMLTTPSCVNRSRNTSVSLLFQKNSGNLNADWIRFGTMRRCGNSI